MAIDNENPKNKYANWKAPDQASGQGRHRKAFNELPPKEQEQRFDRFRQILTDGSQYRDFWENSYKYPDRFIIEGQTKEQVPQTLNMIRQGARFTKDVLNFFREIKLRENGEGDAATLERRNTEMTNSPDAQHFIKDKKVDVRRLDDMFEWSLNAFISKAEGLGRKADIMPEEVEGLKEDMGHILKKVNDYAH
ncbi:MAG TPA: hypothetical protein VE973_03660 [Candidatus Limnocylindria bacterium]|nr:hypothetical protein [Candidatus Limnocylindria bacterium]